MTLFKSLLVSLFVGGLCAGCAQSHRVMRGSVVMKASETAAQVCLGSGDVAAGDEVDLYRNTCKPTSLEPSPTDCYREAIGRGKVTAILNEHFSTVQFPGGTPFKEGDTVEKPGK